MPTGASRVDLVGGYSLAGLAGTAITQPSALFRTDPAVIARLNELSARASLDDIVPSVSPASAPLPAFLIGGWADSLANIASRRYPTGTVQLQVEFPVGNRTAKANLAKSRIEQTQLARQRLQLEQAIEAEVRNALQAVESSNQRLTVGGHGSPQRPGAVRQRAPPLRFGPEHGLPAAGSADLARHRTDAGAPCPRRPQSGDRGVAEALAASDVAVVPSVRDDAATWTAFPTSFSSRSRRRHPSSRPLREASAAW